MGNPDLQHLVNDFASAIESIDRSAPVRTSSRTGKPYQPGIGPHPETETVAMVATRLASVDPSSYGDYRLGEPYPGASRQKCDWTLGDPRMWAIEVKMLRLMGDNGKPNDNMLMHILSPYPGHRSALTDVEKLAASGFDCSRAVLIYGFDDAAWPMDLAIDSFEVLAQGRAGLSERRQAPFKNLIHPVHREGWVVAWQILGARSTRHYGA